MAAGTYTCPYCNDRKVLPGFNSFDVTHKDLMKEWMWTVNCVLCDSHEIGDKYNKNIWWQCQHNPDHKYPMSPKRRVYYQNRHMDSCPFCKGYRRKIRYF